MREPALLPIEWNRLGRGLFSAATIMLLRTLFLGLLSFVRSLSASRMPTVAVLTASLILAPLPASFAHERTDLAAQSDMSALDVAEHGHSHDNGEIEDDPANHAHGGHDPADHSHQFGFLPGSVGHDALPLPQRWPSLGRGTPEQATGLGIERPPKQVMSL
jgi:hypothetical protein